MLLNEQGYASSSETEAPFDIRVERAYNQLCRDIAETRQEIACMGASWWDIAKYNRHLAILHLQVRCATARTWRNPLGLFKEDSEEFFHRLDSRYLDKLIIREIALEQ
jgi:hypothetical protein